MWRSSVAAVVALLLFGCGNQDPLTEPPPPAYPVNLAAVLANHKAAIDNSDTTKILKDYDDASVVHVRTEALDTGVGTVKTYIGPTQIGEFFDGLLKDLKNFEVVVEKQPDEAKVMVKAWFLCWRSINSGYWGVSETFIFDDSLKISVHNIAIIEDTSRTSLSVSQDSLTKVASFDSTSVEDALGKHQAALNDVPLGNGCPDNCIPGGIPAGEYVNLYAPGTSTIYMMDWVAEPKLVEYEGTSGHVDYYNALSVDLPKNPSSAGYIFEDPNLDAHSAFLQWRNPEWKSASNTLVYSKDNYKILFHTITKRAVTSAVDFTV